MPIIIEGGSRCAGWWWARHLQNTETNERAQLVGIDGLSSESLPELFREMRGMAMGSKATNYFYQANINPRADEHLTPAQRAEAVATLGRNLGLDGQPHFVVEHEKNGRIHQHAVWLRVDLDTMKAIPDSLTARIHEQTSRELETKFGLEPGRSVLVADRDFERPDRLAQKHERFRGAQSGIDPRAVAGELRTLREHSDNAASFRAGMEAAGYVLARGDRRDYVVVDQAGHEHALARQLGVKAAELRQYMQGIDRESLPGVAEAKSQQQARATACEARRMRGRAGQGGGERPLANVPPGVAESERKAERPLNETQGAIRAAWALSHTAEQLTEALAARGIGLARATETEAQANLRARAFAREVGRFVVRLNEGEIVAINEKGHIYRLDPRITGVERGEIDKRLAGVEAHGLLGVTDTKQVMREAARAGRAAARRDARDRQRPRSGIEEKVLLAERQSRAGVEAERDGETVHLTGGEALAVALDRAGIAIVRVSAADLVGLGALRRDEELARVVADTNREARHRNYVPTLGEGEIAAVDRFGNVHALNAEKIDVRALLELGDEGLSSVTEARARFEGERQIFDAFREEMMEARMDRAADIDAGAEQIPGRDNDDMRSPAGVAGGMAAAAEAVIAFLADFIISPPPLTKEQIRQRNEVAKEKQEQRAEHREKDEHLQEMIETLRAAARDKEQQEERDRASRQQKADRGYPLER